MIGVKNETKLYSTHAPLKTLEQKGHFYHNLEQTGTHALLNTEQNFKNLNQRNIRAINVEHLVHLHSSEPSERKKSLRTKLSNLEKRLYRLTHCIEIRNKMLQIYF